MTEAKEAYVAMQKKYGLPEWNTLDFEFEVSTIEKTNFILREVRKRIAEKVETLNEALINILQPDTVSFSSMYECNFFSQDEKEKLMDLYKKIMVLFRTMGVADLKQDEKFDADVIKQAAKEMPALRLETMKAIEKVCEGWKETEEVDELLGYLG